MENKLSSCPLKIKFHKTLDNSTAPSGKVAMYTAHKPDGNMLFSLAIDVGSDNDAIAKRIEQTWGMGLCSGITGGIEGGITRASSPTNQGEELVQVRKKVESLRQRNFDNIREHIADTALEILDKLIGKQS